MVTDGASLRRPSLVSGDQHPPSTHGSINHLTTQMSVASLTPSATHTATALGSTHSVNRQEPLNRHIARRRSIAARDPSIMSGIAPNVSALSGLPNAINPHLSVASKSSMGSGGVRSPILASKQLMEMSSGSNLDHKKDLEAGTPHPTLLKSRSMAEMVDDTLLKSQPGGNGKELNEKEKRRQNFWKRVLSIRTITVAMFLGMLLFNSLFIFLFLLFSNKTSIMSMTDDMRETLTNNLMYRLQQITGTGEQVVQIYSELYRLNYFHTATVADFEAALPYMMSRLNATRNSINTMWIMPVNELGGGAWGVIKLPDGTFDKWTVSDIAPANATWPLGYQYGMDPVTRAWKTYPDYDYEIPAYTDYSFYDWTVALDPAKDPNKMIWTSPYIYADGRAYLSVSRCAFDNAGTFIGWVGSDLFLGLMTDTLQSLTTQSKNSIIYIVNTDTGELVGSSDFRYNVLCNGQINTNVLEMCTNTSVATVEFAGLPQYMRDINDIVGNWSTITTTTTTSLHINSTTYFLSIQPFTNTQTSLSWAIVILLDRATYLSSVDRATNIAIAVVVVLIIVSAGVTLTFAIKITKPLMDVATRMNMLFKAHSTSSNTMVVGEEGEGEGGEGGGKGGEERGGEGKAVAKASTSKLAEIQALESSFNTMKSSIRAFQKFVHPLVVQRIIWNEPGAAEVSVMRKEVTIFFSDIKNFTVLSESLPVAVLITILSKYLDFMTKVIARYEGIVADFIGDAIMAFWEEEPDHALRATQCALDQQKAMQAFNTMLATKGYQPMTVRMGLHVGTVLVGNIGSEHRLKYGCVGDDVNLCSRLEGLNKRYNTRIIVSQELVDKWESRTYESRALENVVVKGRTHATYLHELCGEAGEVEAEIVSRNQDFTRLRVAVEGLGGGVSSDRRESTDQKGRKSGHVQDSEEAAENLLEEVERYLRKYPDDLAGVLLRDRLTSGNYAGAVKLTEK
ncbi:hypothetical protein HDV00_005409 [Rhizophlyctis rosea]|nr:hypothetical protein HDV00_005409 [Rhizophlyctis rosea]